MADAHLELTAAVYDASSGQTWVYEPTLELTSASVMKADILETLLARAEHDETPLTTSQQALASAMIEQSTNTAAQTLWTTLGGAPAVAAFDASVGTTETVPNPTGYWGLSTTSAVDQVRLVRAVAFENPLLDTTARSFAINLMTHVEPGQAWGVSAGTPADATVALKNGWDPIDGAWEVNSVGWVHGDGADYVIAVLCWGAPSSSGGIGVIDGLSERIWDSLDSTG